MSKLTRFTTKPVRMPINWALPRHAVDGAKEFKFSSSRYPICPCCSLARFAQKTKPTEDGDTIWFCDSCDFTVVTHHPTLDSIQRWCRENAKNVYDNSEYQQQRIEEYHDGDFSGFIGINVRRNMLACYAFLFLAIVIGMLFIYAALNALLFFLFNTLLFSLSCLFMALVFNYRAWQAMSNSMYNTDAKAQFHWWVKTHPWYHMPRDIGLPNQPTDDEGL